MPKPRKRYFVKAAGIVAILAFASLFSAAGLLWLAGQGLLPFDVALPAQALLTVWILLLVVSTVLMFFDLANVTPRHRDQQPYQPPDDEVARALVYGDYECFIYGKPGQTLREVLLNDWPLDESLKKRNWYVVDSQGNDVTDRTFLKFDGTVQFRVD